MKTTAIITAILTALTAVPAIADSFGDTAQVLSSTPNYRTVMTQDCHTEDRQVMTQASADRPMGGSILGGIAGALLGSRFGGGNGRIAASAVGAVTGAVVGDRMQNDGSNQQPQQQVSYQPTRVCNPIEQQVISGYNVTYQYAGHTGHTMTQQQPGDTIPVRISAGVY